MASGARPRIKTQVCVFSNLNLIPWLGLFLIANKSLKLIKKYIFLSCRDYFILMKGLFSNFAFVWKRKKLWVITKAVLCCLLWKSTLFDSHGSYQKTLLVRIVLKLKTLDFIWFLFRKNQLVVSNFFFKVFPKAYNV